MHSRGERIAGRYLVGIYPDSLRRRVFPLGRNGESDSTEAMIRAGFLDSEARQDLIELARDGSAAHRLGRRANALVLLGGGVNGEAIARAWLLGDDTLTTWLRLYLWLGTEGRRRFGYECGCCRLRADET